MLRPKDLLDLSCIRFESNEHLPPGRAMLVGPEVIHCLSMLAIDKLLDRKTSEEVDEEIVALAGAAVHDHKVVLVKNIGKESGNHEEDSQGESTG